MRTEVRCHQLNNFSSSPMRMCQKYRIHRCFLCKHYARDESMWRCGAGPCGKFYHHSCLRKWQRTLGLVASPHHDLTLCPRHNHCGKGNDCVGPDAQALVWRCLRCPVVYHEICRPRDVHIVDFSSQFFSCANSNILQDLRISSCLCLCLILQFLYISSFFYQ